MQLWRAVYCSCPSCLQQQEREIAASGPFVICYLSRAREVLLYDVAGDGRPRRGTSREDRRREGGGEKSMELDLSVGISTNLADIRQKSIGALVLQFCVHPKGNNHVNAPIISPIDSLAMG